MIVLLLPGMSLLSRAGPLELAGGHLKAQGQVQHYPRDSLLRRPGTAVSQDLGAELRLRGRARSGPWDLELDYQLLGRWGDSAAQATPLPGAGAPLPGDDRRWWDLTDTVDEGGRHRLVQRLDRFNVGYTGERLVLRLGRQAISWGNGLIYNPVDVFNPFDPAAVDTEYKPGDDMLYGQYLLDSGSDLQWVQVQRRDAAGERSADLGSTALKFHGFAAEREYDLLLAEHYGEAQVAVGGAFALGDAVLRGDLVAVRSEGQWVESAVLSGSWSWQWYGRNVSGVLEYFHNGFGLEESEYSLQALADDTALGSRLARGELFTVGRHYLAAAVQLEWTPLLTLSPTLFGNLGDRSGLLQLALRWDLAQEWRLLGALNLPLGPGGTEFGGLPAGRQTLAAGAGAFVQLARYF